MIDSFDRDKQLNMLVYQVNKLESRVCQLEAQLYDLQVKSHSTISCADFDRECHRVDDLEMYMDKLRRAFD